MTAPRTGSLAPCLICGGRGCIWVEVDATACAPDGEPWTHYPEPCAWCSGLGRIALPLLPALALADVEGRLGAYWTHPADRAA